MHLRRVLIGGSTLAVAMALMSAPTAGSAAPTSVAGAASSTLNWQPCASAAFAKWPVFPQLKQYFQCATLVRPLERAKPKGAKVTLALVKLPATGTPQQRKGVLLWNPGGPGQSGVELSSVSFLLPEQVRQSFDFITWDPRGIGVSTPAITGPGCEIPKPTRPATGTVDWAQVLKDRVPQVRRMNARCFERNRSIIENAGTLDNAYDIEAMRQALGEEQINYWGLSYGTLLGSTYLQLFPERVRAAVLDSNMDPQMNLHDMVESAVAPDHSLGFFLEANPEIAAQYSAVMRSLNRKTLTLPNGDVYTRWDVLDVLNDSVMFYTDPSGDWSVAEQVISTAHAAIFGSGAAQQAALTALQNPDLQSPSSGTVGSLWSAVVCQDFADRLTPAEQRSQLAWAVRNGPFYGGTLGTDMVTTCDGYEKARPHPVPRPKAYGPNVPVMVSASTRDGETPYQWSVNMARVYRNSRMVTLVGGLHGTFGLAESDCVNTALGDFLISGQLPEVDLSCPWTPPAPPPT